MTGKASLNSMLTPSCLFHTEKMAKEVFLYVFRILSVPLKLIVLMKKIGWSLFHASLFHYVSNHLKSSKVVVFLTELSEAFNVDAHIN